MIHSRVSFTCIRECLQHQRQKAASIEEEVKSHWKILKCRIQTSSILVVDTLHENILNFMTYPSNQMNKWKNLDLITMIQGAGDNKTEEGCFHRSAVLSDGLRGGGSLTQQLKLCSFGAIRHKQKCKMKLSLTEGFSIQNAPCVRTGSLSGPSFSK